MVSLGCPKNLVDSEMILGNAGSQGLAVTPYADEADVIIVNTCGFIESAKEESILAILEACEAKRSGPEPKKVVVTGCLAQRYGEELRKEVPDVDAIIGLGEYDDIGVTIRKLCESSRPGQVFRISDPTKACSAEVGRFRITPQHFAYVKISEGCDNPCTFCAIPGMRGAFRSKPIEMIEDEVRELVESGAKEILLISQDTTSYGVDLTGRFDLDRLLERVAAVPGVEWVRVLYVYPSFVTDAMIDAIAGIDKVLKYVDIPLQHISDAMLRRMGRRSNEAKTRGLLERMRERIPGLYLRTTFLVGFPGESEQDFETLCRFVEEFSFERLGVFPYSEEEGTPAARFADQIDPAVRAERVRTLMLRQQAVAFRHNRLRKGTTERVLVDSVEQVRGGGLRVTARSRGEAPEIDPVILIRAPSPGGGSGRGAAGARRPAGGRGAGGLRELRLLDPADARTAAADVKPGQFLNVRITGTKGYDLLAEVIP